RHTPVRGARRRADHPHRRLPVAAAAVRGHRRRHARPRAGRLRRLPDGRRRLDRAERAEPGHPVHPGRRRLHGLRPAAGRPLPGGPVRARTARGGIRVAVRGTVEPIVASGGTVILGVLCLLASDLASNRGLGPVAALGIGAALVSALTFLPAVLLLLGRAAFWPVRPRFGTQEGDADSTAAVVGRHRLWGRIANSVDRRPRAYWMITVVVLAAAAAFVPQFKAEGTSQLDVFRTEVESVAGQRTLERGFGAGSSATPATILASEGQAEQVKAAAEGVPGVTEVTQVD